MRRKRELDETGKRLMRVEFAQEDFIYACCSIPHSERPPALQEALEAYFKKALER